MKTSIKIIRTSIALILLMLLCVCSPEEVELPVVEVILPNTANESSEFVIVSNNVKETDTGYEFDGILKSKSNQGNEFDIVKGNISIVIDQNGKITRISGLGYPYIPDVGNFKSLLRDFDWNEAVNSHIEFEKGSFYKTNNNTEFPLEDDTYYFHFQPFDLEKGDHYQLKSKGNQKLYEMFDMYIDPEDPSIFFKLSVPSKKKSDIENTTPKTLKSRIFESLMANIKSNGGVEENDESEPDQDGLKFNIGLSNNGNINSTPYEFRNAEKMQEIYGYSGFKSQPSHIYLGTNDVPIPQTAILAFSGEHFFHYPVKAIAPNGLIKKENDWGNYFSDVEMSVYSSTYTGSINPGDKFGKILGFLPKINSVLGKEIFNEEINLDVVGGSMQISQDLSEIGKDDNNYFRLGIEFHQPIIDDILSIEHLDLFTPTPSTTNFLYLSLGLEPEDWSFYVQEDFTFGFPFLPDNTGSSENSFFFNKDGIKIKGFLNKPLGILQLNNEYDGSLTRDALIMNTFCDNNITLKSGLVLSKTRLDVTIRRLKKTTSTLQGIHLKGSVDLPFGIVDATTEARYNMNGFSAEGSFNSGITLPNGTEINSFGSGFTYNLSSDPKEGLSIRGFIDAPGNIGEVEVAGWIRDGELYLYGIFNGNVNFKGVNLAASNGEIEISSSNGFKISADFRLSNGLGSANMSGYVTKSGFSLEGSLQSKININGHQFTLANSRISAGNNSGVQVSGEIDLYAFKANLLGSINPDGTFLLTGSRTVDRALISSLIEIRVSQNEVKLSGNGCLFDETRREKCGDISFNPNWNNKTIQACIGKFCIGKL